jgi:thiosulfate dehydrogenase [quinone] large subunit
MQNTINYAEIQEPPFAKFLFGNTKMSWLWLIVRLYVGWEWFHAGWEKLHNTVWVGEKAGTAITGFLAAALKKTAGAHPDVQGWYGSFLQNFALPHAAGLSYLVTYGELLVGIALILGLLTGIAAFFGTFMNLNYLFAGTVSINPLLGLLGLFLILAWRTAGWYGLDRFLLPALGTPWQPGRLFQNSN